jgi:hypothetical protein
MAGNASLDKKLDGLYGAALGDFVGLRDRLARALREDGDRATAEEVKKLRKPTVAAWAVNQLARREKMRLRGLFTAGERLRAAQEKALTGGSPNALEGARDDERAAIGQLTEAARGLLEEAGHPPSETVLERIRETLHAAIVDEEIGQRVRTGRLEREEQATGFGSLSLTAIPTQTDGRPEQRRKSRQKEAARERRRAAEERLREARRALAEAEKAVVSRQRELERAERELASHRSAVENAERAVERARPRQG